jgi:hypothetical protein
MSPGHGTGVPNPVPIFEVRADRIRLVHVDWREVASLLLAATMAVGCGSTHYYAACDLDREAGGRLLPDGGAG